ncbi:hypothetical protein J132_10508 [Termitomyces sp. J132]|nr:hypothetical protein J132_10508 [Termitomyces sp. J132]
MTFTRTNTPGATMKLTFEGVGITVYGSKGNDHGDFKVTLDGKNIMKNESAGSRATQIPIFDKNDLSPGKHSMTISNSERKPFVIDYLTWLSNVSVNKTGSPLMAMVDDTDPTFNYNPGAWSNMPPNNTLFYNKTGHLASQSGSTVVFTFTGVLTITAGLENPVLSRVIDKGDAVAIYGSADANLEIDYANVYTLLSLNSSSSSPTQTPVQTPRTNSTLISSARLSAGAIAGISIAAASIIILMFLAGFLVGLRRSKKKSMDRPHIVSPPFTPAISQIGRTVKDSRHISPFRLLMPTHSRTTSDSGQSKSFMDRPNRLPVIRAPSIQSNLSTTLSTLIADDGSDVIPFREIQKVQHIPQYARDAKSSRRR